MTLKDQIKIFFKGDILDDDEALKRYSIDASVFSVKPQIVLFPKDSEDIQNIVKFALEKKKEGKHISVTARGAGTCMSGGSLNDSIILDTTKYMSGVFVSQNEKEAVVLPGTFYRDLEKATLAKGLLMPAFPASKNICTVGGMVMNDSGGEKTLAYGKTGDYVKELKMVFSDGNEYTIKPLSKSELNEKTRKRNFEGLVYKKLAKLIEENSEKIKNAKPNVSKNSAGYFLWDVYREDGTFDLNKILVGSQGTLGIVTEITFSLVKEKKHSGLVVLFLKKLSDIPRVVNTVLPYKPESLESYDNHTIKTSLRFLPELVKQMKTKNTFKLIWSFVPELISMINGLPKLVVLAEFSSDSFDDVERRIKNLSRELSNFGIKNKIAHNEEESEKYWTIRRESFNFLRKINRGLRTAPFIDDFIVRPEFLPEFLPKLESLLNEYKLKYTVAGHIGDGNFHIIPLMDIKNKESKKIIVELSAKVYDLVLEYKGSITAEHNDGIIRTPFLEKMYGKEIIALFKETKEIFDPENIFNPGKKVGDTKKYLLEHITS